ncbi:MAG: glycoside hydrolase family 5 protein [Clostridia bacterium]|nr:glycoside hydrolase family 5 protein [Clostridia bacterium]
MKKLICILVCFVFVLGLCSCKDQKQSNKKANESVDFSSFEKSGKDFCKNIKVGWNLGNTLDACEVWGDVSKNPTPEEQETAWNNPKTSQKIIDKVVSSGFNAVRIPVTWYLQTTEKDGKYTVKPDFLKRVKEVVNYCINDNLYVIINVHHDDKYWLNISVSENKFKKVIDKYAQIWEQIANCFKDYDSNLIFEAGNEIIANTSYDGCGDSKTEKCWWGHNEECYERINLLFNSFYKKVRNSGGNNKKRYLMYPTYGAQWYEQQISRLEIPENDDHSILDIHWYQPNFENGDENKWVFELMKKFSEETNCGAVIGETGFHKTAEERKKVSFANSVVKVAKEYSVPCFLWDDGGDMQLLERDKLKWNCESFIKAVMKAVK